MVDILEKIKSYKLQEIIVDKVERPVAYLEEQVYQTQWQEKDYYRRCACEFVKCFRRVRQIA